MTTRQCTVVSLDCLLSCLLACLLAWRTSRVAATSSTHEFSAWILACAQLRLISGVFAQNTVEDVQSHPHLTSGSAFIQSGSSSNHLRLIPDVRQSSSTTMPFGARKRNSRDLHSGLGKVENCQRISASLIIVYQRRSNLCASRSRSTRKTSLHPTTILPLSLTKSFRAKLVFEMEEKLVWTAEGKEVPVDRHTSVSNLLDMLR